MCVCVFHRTSKSNENTQSNRKTIKVFCSGNYISYTDLRSQLETVKYFMIRKENKHIEKVSREDLKQRSCMS